MSIYKVYENSVQTHKLSEAIMPWLNILNVKMMLSVCAYVQGS